MKDFVTFLKKYLSSNIEALGWVLSYVIYCNLIDDIVDNKFDKEDKPRKLLIVKTFELSLHVYSSEFYVKNMYILFPLMKMAGNSYMDSIIFEDSKKKWKRNLGDSLRSDANNVTLAVIEIVCGIDKRIEASQEIRELSYNTHHDNLGRPC